MTTYYNIRIITQFVGITITTIFHGSPGMCVCVRWRVWVEFYLSPNQPTSIEMTLHFADHSGGLGFMR